MPRDPAAAVHNLRDLKRTRGGRERLLAVAAELFRTRSLAGTSLQMIADRLGVTKPAIYHHFRSRDDIVSALMQPVLADASAAVDHLRSLGHKERHAATRAFFTDFVVKHRDVIGVVFFDRAAMAPAIAKRIDELVDEVAALLSDKETPGSAILAMALVYGIAAATTRLEDQDDTVLHATVTEAFASALAK